MGFIKNFVAASAFSLLAGCTAHLPEPEVPKPKPTYSYNNVNLDIESKKDAEASVVKIKALQRWTIDIVCQQLFDLEEGYIAEGVGSASVVREDDNYQYLFTAYHVVNTEDGELCKQGICMPLKMCGEKAGEIKIKVFDKNINLELLTYDKQLDVAYLKTAKTPELHTFEGGIGDSDKLDTGNFLYSVSYPNGLDKLLTEGIVSSKTGSFYFWPINAPLKKYNEFTNTVPISPGSSGGAIFAIREDEPFKGKLNLVGIITGYIKPPAQNFNFATRINDVMRMVEKYEKTQKEKVIEEKTASE